MPRIGAGFAIAGLVLVAAGCGSERSFTAEEFVDAANSNGAGVVLGEPLSTSGSGDELYSLRLSRAQDAPAPQQGGDAGHGAGSLKVTADAEQAAAEYQRCEEAVTLICYRAANVALVFEGLRPQEQARLDRALEALAEDDAQ